MVVPGSSSSSMRGLVALIRPGEGGISRNLLRRQKRRCAECTSASGVVPSGMKPRFAESRTIFRGHAVLVSNAVTSPGSAALPVITPTLSPPCLPPCSAVLQLLRRERRWELRGRLGKNNWRRTNLKCKPSTLLKNFTVVDRGLKFRCDFVGTVAVSQAESMQKCGTLPKL